MNLGPQCLITIETNLGCASDHIFNEVPMSRSINDGDCISVCLEFPKGDINGDSTLPLHLQLIQDPCKLERALADLE